LKDEEGFSGGGLVEVEVEVEEATGGDGLAITLSAGLLDAGAALEVEVEDGLAITLSAGGLLSLTATAGLAGEGGGEAGFTAVDVAVALEVAVAVEGAEAAAGGLGGDATGFATVEVEVEVEVEVGLTSSFPTTETLVCHSSNALNCGQIEISKKEKRREACQTPVKDYIE
jgi:hypothetical protein